MTTELALPRRKGEQILTALALLAPTALLFPWAAVPGHLGVELGGPGLFLHWLTKYPNWGPVNVEVLLGALCIIGASAFPFFFAVYRMAAGRRRVVLAGLAVASLTAYVPVLIRLDIDLWLIGIYGAPTLAGPVSMHEAAGGPLVRALAVLAVLSAAMLSSRTPKSQRNG